MKIVSLNVQRGTQAGLVDYIREQAKTTDVFCFQEFVPEAHLDVVERRQQEVLEAVYKELSEFRIISAPNVMHPNDSDAYRKANRNAICTRARSSAHGRQYVLENRVDNINRTLLWALVVEDGVPVTIATTHGFWNSSKDDCTPRITQARNTRAFLDTLAGHAVLAGDFNFRPDTESYRITRGDWQELVMDNNIPTTRSPLYTKGEKYADYCFVTPHTKVESFAVPPVLASDHLPLELVIRTK